MNHLKQLCVLIFALCTLLPASAETLITEDFNYPNGTELTTQSWFTQWGSESGILVTSGLELSGFAGCGVGGAAVLDCVSSSAQPHLAFRQQTEGDVYVSMMFQPVMNFKKSYFFCLRDSLINASTFNYNARIFMGEDGRLGLAFADNQKVQFAGSALSSNRVYLLVLKYSIVPGDNNDKVSLYCFPNGTARPANEAEATPLLADLQDANKPDISPAHVVLRGYDANGWLVVDGIRVATTWAEAIASAETGDCGLSDTALEPTAASTSATKVLRNGQLLIRHNGQLISVLGCAY